MDIADSSERQTIAWRQPAVGWNDWKAVSVPRLGEWEPHLSLAVIIPVRDGQAGLDMTLSSLAEQTYPSRLLRVIVADDASDPALVLPENRPENCELLRLQASPGFGAGRARRRGAAAAVDADIILFADADIVLHRQHVEAHARWHHALDYAVTLGYRRFVSFEELSAEDVAQAVRHDRMEMILEGRPSEGHDWLEAIIDRSDNLTRRGESPFRVAVGANIGVRRELYEAAGGFAAFGRRGIEDTETGFRLQMAGALFVPDRQAMSWHQGVRTMAGVRAQDIKRERQWLIEHQIPASRYRQRANGRQYAVPMLQVVVDSDSQVAEVVCRTVNSILANTFTDLRVTVVAPAELRDRQLLLDAYGPDGRVTIAEEVPDVSPAPFRLAVPAGYRFGSGAVGMLLDEIERRSVGALRLVPASPVQADAMPTLWRTDARRRAALVCLEPNDREAAVGLLYGEWWVDSTQFDIIDPVHAGAAAEDVTLSTQANTKIGASDGAASTHREDLRFRALEEQLRERELQIARLRRRRALRWADRIGRARKAVLRWSADASTSGGGTV